MKNAKPIALISVSDKTDLLPLAKFLANEANYELVASGGTAKLMKADGLSVTDVSDLTGQRELLGGRVKTLHPVVHAGILAKATAEHFAELVEQNIRAIELVICNLYPFEQTIAKPDCTVEEAIENIDIGGVTLLRAAAKNHDRVTVISNPSDYGKLMDELKANKDMETSIGFRRKMAIKAFDQTTEYDSAIGSYMKKEFAGHPAQPATPSTEGEQHWDLKYGMNPHQKPASVEAPSAKEMPIKILNGSPGYINVLDALAGWQLVKELKEGFGTSAAASFKHVSPAGCAVYKPMTKEEAVAYQVDDIMDKISDSPLAIAYARARGADRLSSFGDFIALSDRCDEATARVIGREVSDGIIAPDYDPKALDILTKKKKSTYIVLLIDATFSPAQNEERTVFGMKLKQRRNDCVVDESLFRNIVSKEKNLPKTAVRDMMLGMIALKYAQSNSVCYVRNCQVIGMGCGQQSRIHCTKLAGEKAATWWYRQHPRVQAAKFRAEVRRSERANAIDALFSDDNDLKLDDFFDQPVPQPLTKEEKATWLRELNGVSLCSDAFFPFRDNVDKSIKFGVRYIASPGGSSNDDSIVRACDEHDVTLVHTGARMFTH